MIILLTSALCHSFCSAQFDFNKEVASFVDFGKIPSEFSTRRPKLNNFSPSLTSTSTELSTSVSSVFNAFTTSYENVIDDNEAGTILEKNDKYEPIEYDHLPEFGEIVDHLTENSTTMHLQNINKTEDDIKKRSYGGHHGGLGGGGYGGGHHDSYGGGHSSGYGGGHDIGYSGGHDSGYGHSVSHGGGYSGDSDQKHH